MKSSVDILFEEITQELADIAEFNRRLHVLDERRRKECTIYPTDSGNKIRKKCKKAYVWGLHYAPVWNRYMQQPPEPAPAPAPDTGAGDSGADAGGDSGAVAGGDAGGVGEIKGSGLEFPNSPLGPEDVDTISVIQKKSVST
jgi:hypothetical protein